MILELVTVFTEQVKTPDIIFSTIRQAKYLKITSAHSEITELILKAYKKISIS